MAELREALEAAVTEAETPDETQQANASPDTEVVQDSPSNEQPEVANRPADVAPDIQKDEPVQATPATPETPEQKAIHRVDRAPASWKKEAKGAWTALPLHVRQEVYRREQQVNQVMVEASKNREAVEQLNKIIAPFAPRLQAMGGVMPAIENLMRAEHVLATGNRQQTAQAMAQLIKDYNIDIQELDAVLSGQYSQQQAPQQPDISQLVQRQVQQALAPIYQERQVAQQRIQQQAVMTVEEMSLDPQYPFFEDVREDMADIMEIKAKKGFTITLPEAYNIAIQMNPETAGQMRQQATLQTATSQHQQAQRARVASSSVSGSPAVGGSQSVSGNGSLRGAIEAAFGNNRL